MTRAEMLLSILNRLAVVALLAVKELLVMPVAFRFVRQTHTSVGLGGMDFLSARAQ
jgi:hypothetical protein